MPDIEDMRSRLEALPVSVLSDAEQRWRDKLVLRIDTHQLITSREWVQIERQVNEMRMRNPPMTKPPVRVPEVGRTRFGLGGKPSQPFTGDVVDEEGRPRPDPRGLGGSRAGRALRTGS